jgi:hypothetical protein
MSERSLLTADWLISNDVQAFAILHCWTEGTVLDTVLDQTVQGRTVQRTGQCPSLYFLPPRRLPAQVALQPVRCPFLRWSARPNQHLEVCLRSAPDRLPLSAGWCGRVHPLSPCLPVLLSPCPSPLVPLSPFSLFPCPHSPFILLPAPLPFPPLRFDFSPSLHPLVTPLLSPRLCLSATLRLDPPILRNLGYIPLPMQNVCATLSS